MLSGDVSYAEDDGTPFPGWAPPPLTVDEAAGRYDTGERFAALWGDPADPASALVIDRRNGRVGLTVAETAHVLIFSGTKELALSSARWRRDRDELTAERQKSGLLRVRRRPVGAPVWVEELLARREPRPAETEAWPEFGDWSGLARPAREPGQDWWDDGVLDLVDADGWLLDALAGLDASARWRELARRHDAPRAFGLPPPVQAKLAEPRGWRPAGRRWRRADEVAGAVVLTDASFVAGAGGGSEVSVSVSRDPVEVVLTLPAATARLETRSGGAPRSPAQPRPSASAQVAVSAVLELAEEVHAGVVGAVRDGAIPAGWSTLGSNPAGE